MRFLQHEREMCGDVMWERRSSDSDEVVFMTVACWKCVHSLCTDVVQ